MMKLPKRSCFLSGLENQDYLDDYLTGREEEYTPSVNIAGNERRYRIEMGLPGFQKGDFKIDLERDCLTFRGEREKKENYVREEYTRQKFNMESFEKSFQLPNSVDEDHITARHKDGLLEIELPKRKESLKLSKKVKIY